MLWDVSSIFVIFHVKSTCLLGTQDGEFQNHFHDEGSNAKPTANWYGLVYCRGSSPLRRLKGSTMGSLQDLKDATKFLNDHRIHPVVSHVLNGLEDADEGFEILKHGDHFGKIVMRIPRKEDLGAKL